MAGSTGKLERWAELGEIRDLEDPTQIELLNMTIRTIFRGLQTHEERIQVLETAPERQEAKT